MERKYLTISPHFHISFQMPYALWHLLALHTPGSENRTVVNGKACRTPRIYSSADALRMELQLQKPHFHKSPAWKLDLCKTATATHTQRRYSLNVQAVHHHKELCTGRCAASPGWLGAAVIWTTGIIIWSVSACSCGLCIEAGMTKRVSGQECRGEPQLWSEKSFA